MRIIDKIVVSDKEPSKYTAWFKNGELLIYYNGKWTPTSGIEEGVSLNLSLAILGKTEFTNESEFTDYLNLNNGNSFHKDDRIYIGLREYTFYKDYTISDEVTSILDLPMYPSRDGIMVFEFLGDGFSDVTNNWVKSRVRSMHWSKLGSIFNRRPIVILLGDPVGEENSYVLYGYCVFSMESLNLFFWDIDITTESALCWVWSDTKFVKRVDFSGQSPNLFKTYEELTDKIAVLTSRVNALELPS